MNPLYLLESGFLGRSQNTLTFENSKVNRKFPIKNYDSIYLIGEVSLNSKLLNYLAKEQIPVFFFGYYGNYTGVFYPLDKKCISGKTLIKQAEKYMDNNKRIKIAKEVVKGSIHNMRKTLLQYKIKKGSERLKKDIHKLDKIKKIKKLLSLEANSRKYYYKQFNDILKNESFYFHKRSYRPPEDMINCLLSFGNSLLYNSILSEMFKTRLNPLISFLHEPSDNRFSLNLDIADIFKPIIVDRVIFSLINQGMIKKSHFKIDERCYLNKKGRNIFIRKYDLKLKDSLKLPNQDKKVSYRYLLRKECFSLLKYIEDSVEYSSFRMWW